MNPYKTSDDQWFFFTGLEATRHLPAVCNAIGRPELLEDERFSDASAIRRNRTEVIALLDKIIGEQTMEYWARKFDESGVWWAPAQTPAEVVKDPQLLENDGFLDVIGGSSGQAIRSVSGPVTFTDPADPDARVGSAPTTVPGLGEHTDEVLAELESP
jgi:crotonobetainyl-CoA:carnitine CoA-transferase CaiB-like acyl-CoA transferase